MYATILLSLEYTSFSAISKFSCINYFKKLLLIMKAYFIPLRVEYILYMKYDYGFVIDKPN